jgi:hypothetical protein
LTLTGIGAEIEYTREPAAPYIAARRNKFVSEFTGACRARLQSLKVLQIDERPDGSDMLSDRFCGVYDRFTSVGVPRPGVPKPTSECAACPSPDGSSAWASAKGGSEVAADGRERGGNPAAFVFVPRPGRVRLQ